MQIENDVDRFAAVPDSSDEPPSELVRFLRHVERNRALYRSALGEHGSTMFLHALRRRIETDIQHDLGRIDFGSDLPESVATGAITGIVIGILLQWIETDPLPAADVVADWMWRAMPRAN